MRKHHITNPALREHVRVIKANTRRPVRKRAIRTKRSAVNHV